MGRTEVCRCQELDDLSELLLGSASAGESDMWIGWLASAGRLGPLGSALLTAAVRPGPLLLLLPSHSVLPCMLQALCSVLWLEKKVMYLASSRVGSLHKKRVRVVNQASMLLPNST